MDVLVKPSSCQNLKKNQVSIRKNGLGQEKSKYKKTCGRASFHHSKIVNVPNEILKISIEYINNFNLLIDFCFLVLDHFMIRYFKVKYL